MAASRTTFKRLVAVSAIPFLVACGEEKSVEAPVQASRYENVKECTAEGKLSEAQCTAAFEAAQKQHEQHRPRFSSKEDCEKDFGAGKCEVVPQGSTGTSTTSQTQQSSFAPFFMGWMVSNMMNSGSGASGVSSLSSTPLYKTQRNSFVTPSGNTFDTKTRSVAPSAFKIPEKPAVVQPGKSFSETAKPAPTRYTPETARPTERYTPPAAANKNQHQSTTPQRVAPSPAPQRAAPAPNRSPSPGRSFSSPSRSGGFGGGGGSR